ncbi:MAG: Autoinducer 2-degrading protein LsrG [Pseudomonadota bacterium]|jgi:quinol monooxygenase YgiN
MTPPLNSFVVTVLFKVSPDHAAEFHAAVCTQAKNSLDREPECHRFDVCADPTDPCTIFLYELYTDKAAFDVHLASSHFKEFGALVGPWTVTKEVRTFELVPATE